MVNLLSLHYRKKNTGVSTDQLGHEVLWHAPPLSMDLVANDMASAQRVKRQVLEVKLGYIS